MLAAVQRQMGFNDLHGFQRHLDHMDVAETGGGAPGIVIEQKNLHLFHIIPIFET